MRINLLLFILLLVFTFNYNSSNAQLENLTFEVRAQNFQLIDDITNTDPSVSGLWNEMQFDLYIQQTNTPGTDAEKMRFALGQYYWIFNINEGLTNADTTGGYATYSYIPGSTTFSNPNAVPTNPSFLGKSNSIDECFEQGYPVGQWRSMIRTNSNIALGNTSDVQVSGNYPGTKIGRFKLRRKAGFYFPQFLHPHMRYRQGPLNVNCSSPTTKVFAYNGLGGLSTEVTSKGTYIMDTLNSFSQQQIPALNLTMIQQGYYNSLAKRLYKKETVSIEIRQTISPYTVVDTATSFIDTLTFKGSFNFSNLPNGSYYIAVSHKNCLETWSKNPVSFLSGTMAVYNFTDSLNKAYGNNLKLVDTSPIRYGIFSGNVNQDAIIDAADLSMVENDAEAGVTGDVQTDVTGDNFVDGNDLSIVENNAFAGIIMVTP